MSMHGVSNRSTINFLSAFFDGIVIFGSALTWEFLFWWDKEVDQSYSYLLIYQGMLIVFVTQVTYYFFDLYETRTFHNRARLGFRLLEALLVSHISLSIIYLFAPFLGMGRKNYVSSFFTIFLLTYCWRYFSPWVTRNAVFKERILIVGTGVWAKKIAEDIRRNSPDSFEIVGFVDEKNDREKIREAI